jgi:hypothetical protein
MDCSKVRLLIMEKIIIQAVDCYRHDYWKVSVDLLNDLNIIDAISEFSYLGNGSSILNEDGYAYLEIDSDCSIFDKAMKFYDKQYEIDFETLQNEFDEEYEDCHDWLDQLDSFDTEILEEKGLFWELVPEDLAEVLKDSDSDEEDEDDE